MPRDRGKADAKCKPAARDVARRREGRQMADDTGADRLRRMRWCFRPRDWFRGEGEPDPRALEEEDTFVWKYRSFTDDQGVVKFSVGYFFGGGEWFTDGEYNTREEAAARVHWLNGGS